MGNTPSSEQKTSTPNSPASGRPQSVRQKDSLQALHRTTSRQSSTSSSAAVDPARAASTSSKSSHTRNRSSTTPAPALASKPSEPSSEPKASTSSKDEPAIHPAVRASTLPLASNTVPVNVSAQQMTAAEHEELSAAGMETDDPTYGHGPNDYSRPPRLPLPIEEELHTPGSPIITPQDVTSAIDERDIEGTIPRRTSVLSSTTADEDELAENESFPTDNSLAPVVPTLVEWKGPGNKVYVTGTFVLWEKKFKLHRNPKTGHFSATLNLKPGTHHVKFLVDDEMVTSDLPTTVDFTNILVNYIEVVAPPVETKEEDKPAETELPGTAVTEGQAVSADQPPTQPIPIRSGDAQPERDQAASARAQSMQEPIPIPSAGTRPRPASPSSKPQSDQAEPPVRQILPRAEYTTEIPQFMLDLDRYQTPEDERYQRAYRVTSTLPTPPSLPMFLAKSILNGTTPHKDDSSVLNMPNHTVLNHLTTSSIRHQVLATSGTTRYKRKFLTTIMYRPTSDAG